MKNWYRFWENHSHCLWNTWYIVMIYCYEECCCALFAANHPKNSQHSELEQACDFSPHACSSPTLLASFYTAWGSRMLWDSKCASYILGYLHNAHHICLCEMAKTTSIYREASCLYWLICIFSTNLVAQFLIFYLYHRKKKATILTSVEIRGWAVIAPRSLLLLLSCPSTQN